MNTSLASFQLLGPFVEMLVKILNVEILNRLLIKLNLRIQLMVFVIKDPLRYLWADGCFHFIWFTISHFQKLISNKDMFQILTNLCQYDYWQ
jgi:hypothetical protein